MAEKLTHTQLLDRLGMPAADSVGWEELKDSLWKVGGRPLADLMESLISEVPGGLRFESAWFVAKPKMFVYAAADPTQGDFAIVDTEMKPFIAAVEDLRATTNRPSPKMLKSRRRRR